MNHSQGGDALTNQGQGDTAQAQPVYSVCLIDRRSGQIHRVNGAPLLALGRDPERAAAALLEGRGLALWETRTQPLTTRTIR